nr:type IV secretion system protein [Haloactinospora alba]
MRRAVTLALVALAFLLVPLGSQSAQGDPVCDGQPAPQPEMADSGSDGLLVPPKSQSAIENGPNDGLPPDASIYGQYGTSGQQWHVIKDSCIDKMGSSATATLSNTAWDLSKTINQSTITVYQAATSDGLLSSFNSMVEDVINQLRYGIWQPLLPTVIILGAVWLGWYGLIRKRVTLTLESAIWMVMATALGLWILVNPGQILSMAGSVVNSGNQLVNSALSNVSVPGGSASCPAGAEEVQQADWESESDFAVRKNSNMLWSGLVCQPWVAGVFGSGDVAESAAALHSVDLIEAQAISRTEQQQIAEGELEAQEVIDQKQSQYQDISDSIQESYPGVYPLFEGSQQESRLGVASLALFSSIFAGGLILAGSVALIVLKIGFLILFLFSPIFLLVGVHPGYGRTVLLRWFEMLFGLLLKQIFIVLLIALLVMCYGLVMATNLGWGLQMILLALFTLALFIYRKPFAHLFSSVNANTFTSRMVSDTVNSSVLSKSANALPPVAYARAQKWGLKRSPQLAAAAGSVPAAGGGAAAGAASGEAADGTSQGTSGVETGEAEGAPGRDGTRVRGSAGYGRARGRSAPSLNLGKNNGGDGDPGAAASDTSTRRSTSEAPRLSEAASGGLGTPGPSGNAPGSGGGGDGGPIPPRPAGGYTGTGDTGWASIFGTGAGSGQRGTSDSGNSGNGGSAGGGGGAASGAERVDPNSGQGIFKGRSATPPQGNVNKGSRWGGSRTKRDKTQPPRNQRPAPPPPQKSGGDGGNWITGSSKRNNDAPTSPFWTGSEGQRRNDRRRDIPFWLRDED